MENSMNGKDYGLWKVFLIGAALFALIMVPAVIYCGGTFLFYGDYNSQQIPFNMMMQRNVHEGALNWNWQTDLGAGVLGSYAFYLFGSPFFWLMSLFPTGTAVYLLPWVLALKYGAAAMTAYAYIRRYVKRREAALTGALLYAFSGFQAFNIFFNHFHDVTAFFPLLLITMEDCVERKKRGRFACAVALMAVVNYYFFAGQVVFCLLYFLVKYVLNKEFTMTVRIFFRLALEAITGVLLACFMLLPAAVYVSGNTRLDNWLYGYDILAYKDRLKWFEILFNLFMMPDMPSRPTLFYTGSKWSSLAGYLPMFSMSGVIAYMSVEKKKWPTRLLWALLAMAAVPILNAAFSALNSEYYARWYYMPVLIMAMVTAVTVEEEGTRFHYREPALICIIMPLAFAALALFLPTEDDDGVVTLNSILGNPVCFWVQVAVTLACGLIFLWVVFKMKRNGKFLKKILALTMLSCVLMTGATVALGCPEQEVIEDYRQQALYAEDLGLDEGEYFRIDTEELTNYSMIWGYSNMQAFQSVVPGSIMEFYPKVGVDRGVKSAAKGSLIGLRALFSVKYYLCESGSEETRRDFVKIREKNGMDIYENTRFVPMGFSFDQFITEAEFEKIPENMRHYALVKYLVLTGEQKARYSHLMGEAISGEFAAADYEEDCAALRETACYDFAPDTDGFTARVNMRRENLLFFSVPYSDGFTAYIDGVPVGIEKVDYGFMAVCVPRGDHEIRFDYEAPMGKTGRVLSGLGVVLLILILLVPKIVGRKGTAGEPTAGEESAGQDAVELQEEQAAGEEPEGESSPE